MTTVINNAEDLLRIVRENEEYRAAMRRELLTEDLLALPQRFTEYAARTDERLDRLTALVGTHQEKLDRLAAIAESHQGRLDELTASSARQEADMGYLKGAVMELTLEKNGLARIVGEFNLRNIRVLRLAEQNRASADFNNAIYNAEDNGIIDRNEYDRLLLTDLIFRGIRRNGNAASQEAVYVATEASFSVESDDITKVKMSADAIKKVFPDSEVQAVLYCESISDSFKTIADNMSVKVLRANA